MQKLVYGITKHDNMQYEALFYKSLDTEIRWSYHDYS